MILLFFAVLPKKDKIDPWHLALGSFALKVRPDN
jgi:hypothetical protein